MFLEQGTDECLVRRLPTPITNPHDGHSRSSFPSPPDGRTAADHIDLATVCPAAKMWNLLVHLLRTPTWCPRSAHRRSLRTSFQRSPPLATARPLGHLIRQGRGWAGDRHKVIFPSTGGAVVPTGRPKARRPGRAGTVPIDGVWAGSADRDGPRHPVPRVVPTAAGSGRGRPGRAVPRAARPRAVGRPRARRAVRSSSSGSSTPGTRAGNTPLRTRRRGPTGSHGRRGRMALLRRGCQQRDRCPGGAVEDVPIPPLPVASPTPPGAGPVPAPHNRLPRRAEAPNRAR